MNKLDKWEKEALIQDYLLYKKENPEIKNVSMAVIMYKDTSKCAFFVESGKSIKTGKYYNISSTYSDERLYNLSYLDVHHKNILNKQPRPTLLS
jgi:hypothetical protein